MNIKLLKNRKKIIALLIMLSVVITSGTFAFWATSADGTSGQAVETLSIGYAEDVQTVFELTNATQDTGLLVPEGQAINSEIDAVEEINLFYNLLWKEAGTISQLDGSTTSADIKITHKYIIESNGMSLDSKEYPGIYELINVTYDHNNVSRLTLDGDTERFAFTVTMDEPETQEAYNIISKSNVSIIFNFSIKDDSIETSTSVVEGPYLSLIGDEIVYIELSDTYVDQGVIAYNSLGEEINGTWFSGDINTWQVGSYTIEYNVYSGYDNMAARSIKRTIVVVDTTAPNVTISGPSTINLSVGDSYSDWGAYAYDSSNTHSAVSKEGSVDTSVAGVYIVTYYSSDASGNIGQAVKTVIVS